MGRLAAPRSASSGRRDLRRASTLLALAALVLVLHPLGSAASNRWCRADPTVSIGGRVGHIEVSSYEAMLDRATGPIRIQIAVPAGVESEVLLPHADNGFGHGYEVTFHTLRGADRDDDDDDDDEEAIRIVIRVYAPASGGRLPVRVDFEPEDGDPSHAIGRSNKWVKLDTHV
jgi:hypothetical protein